MIRAILFGTLVILAGCAGTGAVRTPDSVAILGNDCGNKASLLSWRFRQLEAPQGLLESDSAYKQRVSGVKHEIWKIRYNCNPYSDIERVR